MPSSAMIDEGAAIVNSNTRVNWLLRSILPPSNWTSRRFLCEINIRLSLLRSHIRCTRINALMKLDSKLCRFAVWTWWLAQLREREPHFDDFNIYRISLFVVFDFRSRNYLSHQNMQFTTRFSVDLLICGLVWFPHPTEIMQGYKKNYLLLYINLFQLLSSPRVPTADAEDGGYIIYLFLGNNVVRGQWRPTVRRLKSDVNR